MEERLKFEFADEELVEHFWPEVCQVLLTLGYNPEECFVSDLSQLSDFLVSAPTLYNLISLAGQDLIGNEYLWKLGEMIRKNNSG